MWWFGQIEPRSRILPDNCSVRRWEPRTNTIRKPAFSALYSPRSEERGLSQMIEPTITQNSALYLAQHRPKQPYTKPRRRRLVESINRWRDLRARAFSDVIDLRGLQLREQR